MSASPQTARTETRRNGPTPRPWPTLEELLARTVEDPATGCRLWTGAKFGRTGYGAVNRQGTVRGAHRLAWESSHGPIPDGLHVCHVCDVRACINPDHLFLATTGINLWDATRKGRMARKLTREQVEDIRTRYLPGARAEAGTGRSAAELAAEHGIGRTMIHRLHHRGAWRWIA